MMIDYRKSGDVPETYINFLFFSNCIITSAKEVMFTNVCLGLFCVKAFLCRASDVEVSALCLL